MVEYFNKEAKNWDKKEDTNSISYNIFSTLASRIALKSSMDILDFGCGNGLLTHRVAPLVKEMVGVDIAQEMINELRAKNAHLTNLSVACQDILQMPLDRVFDGIVSSMAMHHVEDTQKLFKTIYDHLKPDGFIALADLDSEDGNFHPAGVEGVFHDGFDREHLRSIASSVGFKNIRFYDVMTVKKPHGDYPIFMIIAYK